MAGLVSVVLRKDGQELRKLNYPIKNAEKLLSYNSGWELNEPNYVYKDGKIIQKTEKKSSSK